MVLSAQLASVSRVPLSLRDVRELRRPLRHTIRVRVTADVKRIASSVQLAVKRLDPRIVGMRLERGHRLSDSAALGRG